MAVLFGNVPKLQRSFCASHERSRAPLDLPHASLAESLDRVLRFPAVGSKQFLVTIGDRSISGFVVRDQMVGPWQVPVADAAVTTLGFRTLQGEAMAMGERSPLALIDPAASARMAIGEALTNLASVAVEDLSPRRVVGELDGCGGPRQRGSGVVRRGDGGWNGTVSRARHCDSGRQRQLVDAYAVARRTWRSRGDCAVDADRVCVRAGAGRAQSRDAGCCGSIAARTRLLLVDLGGGANRLGGSALAQTHRQLGDRCPDVDDAATVGGFFRAVQALLRDGKVIAYHDRSDGGLVVCALEMAFAGRCGLDIDLAALGVSDEAERDCSRCSPRNSARYCRWPQTDVADGATPFCSRGSRRSRARHRRAAAGAAHRRSEPVTRALLDADAAALQSRWAETSYRMQRMRDDPACADEEFARIAADDPGMRATLTFAPADDIAAPYHQPGCAPACRRVARAGREQPSRDGGGVRSRRASIRSTCTCRICWRIDATLRRISACSSRAADFRTATCSAAAAAGRNRFCITSEVRDAFAAFFAADTLSLGVCNGCQMFAHAEVDRFPGAAHWPRFVRNRSEQFEARTSLVRINAVASPWLDGMAGSVLPIAVAHGEGRAEFEIRGEPCGADAAERRLRCSSSTTGTTSRTRIRPIRMARSNGIAGIVNADGRVLAVMPHPERVFRSVNNSWHPGRMGRGRAVGETVQKRARGARLETCLPWSIEDVADAHRVNSRCSGR